MPDMFVDLINASAATLEDCLEEDPPKPFSDDRDGTFLFQRMIEMQIEQCYAISSLCEIGLFRPAFAILRSLLETIATIIWVSLDLKRCEQLIEDRKKPSVKARLESIGWSDEYDRFSILSGYVHGSIENADDYRAFEFYEDGLLPEIRPDTDFYFASKPDGSIVSIVVRPMSGDETHHQYVPYLAAKTFDLVISELRRLYSHEQHTPFRWPSSGTMWVFAQACAANPELEDHMRLMIPK